MKFKIGDKVICISKKYNQKQLIVGGVFFITHINRGFVKVRDIKYEIFANRFKKIDDNKINRLLYPEAFNGV